VVAKGTAFEIAIVGGGPAGLSAALWSARYGHSVVLMDRGDPRNWESRGVNGYLGLPGILPSELRAAGRHECGALGVTLADQEVTHAEIRDNGHFIVHLGNGTSLGAARLLIAVGVRDLWPDVPGLEQVYGANAHVCPDCDGYEASDARVVVIGSGRRAVSMALALTTWTDQLIICTNGHPHDIDERALFDKLDANGITLLTDAIIGLGRDGDRIDCLQLANGMELDADKIFFTLAQYPADDVGVQLGCARDAGGHILVDEHGATSVPGVYASGDITPGTQLALRAAAGGAVAAMTMHKSLVPDHRRLE
jgi:thioredoxin reductase